MGIKIQNTMDHTTIVLSPTWQCPGIIYAFETPQDVSADDEAQKFRVAMVRFNDVRAGLYVTGGPIMDFLDLFGGLFDGLAGFIEEAVLEEIMENVTDKVQDTIQDTIDETMCAVGWDVEIANVFSGQETPRKSGEVARNVFLLGMEGMGLRRQHSIKRMCSDSYALTVQGDRIAWWS
ncbi:hypothetical protein H310_13853 [Aphanomyces invadans]|uniref:Uncharacterized protein n=1 Tax=Aphanomyces invadans TaxID=157072 RepID=A0A024TC28_9STRA|nr:hypothetical protein H310_13853 [Aphanomyces invadans]ETV91603.1 hypothetical protein H310_13853 [Aphanomyces invadans]|eukprot:XP_008879722.1 hypothetical protein H310_13853 [Aphanomyces invadans]